MSLVIGDTPEQLGSCLTANAVMIDGKIITKQQVAKLMAQAEMHRDAEIMWEKTMMQAVGEDGPKSVVEAIDKIKAERDALASELREMTDQRDAFAIRLEDSEEQYSELHNKNSALAAQVAGIKDEISDFSAALDGMMMADLSSEEIADDLEQRLSNYDVSQHHLRELRAEAVEQAVNETKKLESTPCGQWWYCLADDLKKYAEQIRREGK